MADETDAMGEAGRTRAVTEFNITYFDLTEVESEALLDFYATHAYALTEEKDQETPCIGSRSWPTVDAWDQHPSRPGRVWGEAPGLIRMSRFGDGWLVACCLCPPSSTGAPRNFAWPKGDLAEAVNILGGHLRDEHPPQHPQIATQEPAGEPRAGSAGRGASGGLGERLRALGTEIEGANRELARFGLRGVTEGRCLTCPGGYGRHKVGGEYPELPHEVALETKAGTNENVEGRA